MKDYGGTHGSARHPLEDGEALLADPRRLRFPDVGCEVEVDRFLVAVELRTEALAQAMDEGALKVATCAGLGLRGFPAAVGMGVGFGRLPRGLMPQGEDTEQLSSLPHHLRRHQALHVIVAGGGR